MATLIRFLPHLIIALCSLILGALITDYFADKRYTKLEVRFMNYQVAQATALANAVDLANADRDAQARKVQELELASHEKAKTDAKIIADLRTRYDRLRIRKPQCPSTSGVPEAGNPALNPGAGPGGEFLEADGRSFIEIAERAERVRQQALICQEWAKTFLD